MATQSGMGTIEFGILLSGTFKAEDGAQIDGASVAKVNCTSDNDTIEQYGPGDVTEYGEVKVTAFVLTTIDIDGLIAARTIDTLTYTSPDGDTYIGQAFIVSAPIASQKNDNMTRALTFAWTNGYVYTAAP
jgi:hypothetical protein